MVSNKSTNIESTVTKCYIFLPFTVRNYKLVQDLLSTDNKDKKSTEKQHKKKN